MSVSTVRLCVCVGDTARLRSGSERGSHRLSRPSCVLLLPLSPLQTKTSTRIAVRTRTCRFPKFDPSQN